MASKTYPSDPSIDWYAAAPNMHPRGVSTSVTGPTTDFQALMEAPPNTDPEESSMARSARRDDANKLVALVLAIMEPEEAELIRRHHLEDESVRSIAFDLGLSKSQVHRNIQAAFERMQAIITDPKENL